ncbi:MAG: hypothetical protein IJ086_07410 [Clostridium sp.]|nr:hypothetical protein [Clostridium sp.]MBQ8998496.1 hypothetical protein [Clostridium sp.]
MIEIICPSCDSDLAEVGVYYKSYNNFKFNKKNERFEFSHKDNDGVYCSNCDSYVDVNIQE